MPATHGCATIPDNAVALKQALDFLARLFGSQRSAVANGQKIGHIECVPEGKVTNDKIKDLRSLLIDMMTYHQVLVHNGHGRQLDSSDITQKICRTLPFKLREKVREIDFKRSLGWVF